ncbi:DUF1592 domain-containing protein [uncultured Marinobacter sp.]|uniref:DUF1592 domain-containing protein n=1 Tax=uncultured Marinobacter sp. TaxID=187379 RepID=UPI0030D7C58D
MKPLFKLLTLTAGALAGNIAMANQLCTVDYQELNNWGNGGTYNVVVQNHGPAIEKWDLSWSFPGNERVSNLWKGHFEQDGRSVGVIDAGYNGRVASGGQFDFGFNIDNPSGQLPTAFYLNGQDCATGASNQPPVEPPETGIPDDGDASAMGWSLDNTRSTLKFISVKNTDIAENHRFDSLQGFVQRSGEATLAIDLNTIDSGIGIRDQRMRNYLFNTGAVPTLYFTTMVNPADVQALGAGESTALTLDGRLTVNGVSRDTTASVIAYKSADGRVSVRTVRPVIISSGDFELTAGIEALRGLAGLPAIGHTVPVFFNLNFVPVEGNGGNLDPVTVATAPAAPSIVSAAFVQATNAVTVSWQDLSDNETGFVIKRREGSGYWETVGATEANQTTWMDQLDTEGTYAYRVIAINDSVPSMSSGTALVNATPDATDPGNGDDGGNNGGDPGNGDDGGDPGNGDNGGNPGNGDNDGDTGGGNDGGNNGGDNGDADPLNGAELYGQQCAACHGNDGKGGATGVSLTASTELSALSSYITAAMPLGNPGRCGADCADAVADYIADNFWSDDDAPVVLEEELAGPRQLNLLTRYQYQNAVSDLVGIDASNLATNFPVEARVLGFSNNAAKNFVSSRHLDEYMKAAERVAKDAVSQRQSALLPCQASAQGCAQQFVETFGQKAFRRPLSNDERQAYLGIFNGEGNFSGGMEAVIEAMLVSPHFLYISELGTQTNDGNYQLTPYEVASQLSFIYQGTIPDDTLLAAAAANQLQTPAQLEAQARRLLQSDKARTHLGHFAEQWMESDPASMGSKDPNLFPRFNTEVREAMHRELRAFFNHVVFDSTGQFEELLTADYVFVNQPLANYYGLNGVSGNNLRLVQDTTGTRGGLLAMGAVMASHGHANESAPIPRGNFVRRRMMCQELPPPPEDLDTSAPEPDPNFTTRERFESRTSSDDCQTCHLYINGPGFGFEAFDGAGGFRTTDNNKPVNTYGVIYGLESLLDSSSVAYDGVREMQQVIAQTDSVKSCMAKQFYRFSRGYIESASDTNTLDNLTQLFASSDYNLQELIVGLSQLQTFTLRRD